MEVRCFLFTDMLLICKATGKRCEGKVRVIRQPFIVDRLIITKSSKEGPNFGLVYLNEYGTAVAAFTLQGHDSKMCMVRSDSNIDNLSLRPLFIQGMRSTRLKIDSQFDGIGN